MNKESIINKVKALLNKTEENGATKEEAILALQKATELMTKYMIDSGQLKETDQLSSVEVHVPRYKIHFHTIGNALAYLFDSQCIITNKSHNRVHSLMFFGEPQDIELCKWFFLYLDSCLLRDTIEYRRTRATHTLTQAFQQGWVNEVKRRIKSLKDQQERDFHSSGKELVLYNKQALIKIEANKRFNLKDISLKPRNYDNEQAYGDGVVAGNKVELRRVINGSNTVYIN